MAARNLGGIPPGGIVAHLRSLIQVHLRGRLSHQHAARPEFSCRFHWQPGSIAFWDNRCTWHYALNDYAGHRRLMHRITIEGTPLS